MSVPDVTLFPGHIACDAASRSEVVVPLLKGEVVMGVLDVDSPLPNRFSTDDVEFFEQAASIIARIFP
jgi:GAF domain-containing protein